MRARRSAATDDAFRCPIFLLTFTHEDSIRKTDAGPSSPKGAAASKRGSKSRDLLRERLGLGVCPFIIQQGDCAKKMYFQGEVRLLELPGEDLVELSASGGKRSRIVTSPLHVSSAVPRPARFAAPISQGSLGSSNLLKRFTAKGTTVGAYPR